MLNLIIKIMIVCLISTIIIELLGALVLKIKDKKDLINILLVNIMTNPLLVTVTLYINIAYGLKYRNMLIYPLEILVVVIEGLIYKKYLIYQKINPYLISLILNILSYSGGLIINNLIY